MTKNEIINDIKFKQKCGEYGLYWENFEIFDNVILLYTPMKNVYVLLDKNYNTIGVETIPNFYKLPEAISEYYFNYANLNGIHSFGEKFGYPFENYTLKQIVDLSNKIEIIETNHDHSLSTKVNGVWLDKDKLKENQIYIQLLSYVKFIGEEIQNYFLIKYHMQIMDFEMPDIYSYVKNMISKLDQCVNYHISQSIRPCPSNIARAIGQNHQKLNMNGILYDITDLLMKNKGYKVKSVSPNEIEMVDNPDINLTFAANELLKLLTIEDEDLKRKEKEADDKILEQKLASFRIWLEDDIDEGSISAISYNKSFTAATEKADTFLSQQSNNEVSKQSIKILKKDKE